MLDTWLIRPGVFEGARGRYFLGTECEGAGSGSEKIGESVGVFKLTTGTRRCAIQIYNLKSELSVADTGIFVG